MAISKKKVEVFTLDFRTTESFTFVDLITCPEVVDREVNVKGKYVALKILEQTSQYVIGLVETGRNNNIPPKKNLSTRQIAKLGLDENQALAYGNVFIFDTKRSILMYEVNKQGCYIDHFLQFIYKCCRDSETYQTFHVGVLPLLNGNEYQRVLGMPFQKSLEIHVARPDIMFDEFAGENSALAQMANMGVMTGATLVKATMQVSARSDSSGLLNRPVGDIIESALSFLRGPNGKNIKKLIVEGYETDSDDGKLQAIDLIADRYLRHIELEEPRENNNLLEEQRHRKIKALYRECLPDFQAMFSEKK